MIPTPITQEIKLADGRVITIETGKLARQADGAVVVKLGGTMLLATVVSNKDAKEGVDFLPLTVEYREKFSATGRVPGGFIKREGRPSDDEILTMRLVDRVLRPIFPKDYHADTQVIINLISFDPEVAPDSLAGLAASAAISISDIPFNGPIGEVRVARIDGEFVINPSPADKERADIEMMIGGSKESIVMVEGEMEEVSEEEMLAAIEFAHKAIIDQCIAQEELASKVAGSSPKREYSHETHDDELREAVMKATYDKCYEIAKQGNPNKHERSAAFKEVFEAYIADWSEEDLAEKVGLAKTYFHDVQYLAVRNSLLDNGIRLDGRKTTEIRPIWTEVDYLPGGHGSAIFTRGETQSLTTVTLGTSLDVNKIDNATFVGHEKFYLHYNFPPFSTGEARPIRGTSRREIGHGNLAQRALKKMIPADSPYTIRIVSEILESNGSSSMATVCAGTLALMDAGINIKKPVSGIAMGLITDKETGKYQILSDILGDEDHLGDMDFKVTGTRDGITACQMDIKVDGLSYQVLEEALNQAKQGREHILGVMNEVVSQPREDYKPHVPRSEKFTIPKDQIGAVIGPGGKVIQEIQKETGATVNIEEVNDEGVVSVFAIDKAAMEAAVKRIKNIVAVPEVGEVYEGKVKSIMPFGAFIEFMPGKDGLLHISEIKWERLEKMEGVLEVGEEISVKLIGVDKKTGKFRLSRKVLLPKPEKNTEQ
ncbi:MAG: polyribonucleotide nucleotidyltransferase, partial [Flavobacteriia bacterium]|nr:polyribonucleotide nucleotidyltransferase [Flavobacteriia bacterium]